MLQILKGSSQLDIRSSKSNMRILNFLKSHPIGVLATVDPNGNPHATVIYFSTDDEFNVTFTTKSQTKKHDNLSHNNHAMLVAYETFSQTTVQITGTAELITNKAKADHISEETFRTSIDTSQAGDSPISKLYAGHEIAYKLKPVQIRMAVFMRPDPGGYDMYETIDFAP